MRKMDRLSYDPKIFIRFHENFFAIFQNFLKNIFLSYIIKNSHLYFVLLVCWSHEPECTQLWNDKVLVFLQSLHDPNSHRIPPISRQTFVYILETDAKINFQNLQEFHSSLLSTLKDEIRCVSSLSSCSKV